MKRYTTSAQKTLDLPVEDILVKLKTHFEKTEQLKFAETKDVNILKAKMDNGSTLVIAGFDKSKGKTLAMIDHENIPVDKPRTALQKKRKDVLNELFK